MPFGLSGDFLRDKRAFGVSGVVFLFDFIKSFCAKTEVVEGGGEFRTGWGPEAEEGGG